MNWSNSTVLSIYFNVWHIIIITESCFVIIWLSPLVEIVLIIRTRINLITMLFIFVHVHFKFTLLTHAINARLRRNLLKLLATCTLSHVAIPGVWWLNIFFFDFFYNIRHFINFIINNVFYSSHVKQSSTIVFKLVITWSKSYTTHLRRLKMLSHIQWSLFQLICFW